MDREEVLRALTLFTDPTAGVLIQGLPSGRCRVIASTDKAALMRAVEEYADDRGVYWSLSPVPANLGRPIKVGDVLSRRWLLIDVDRKKAETDKDLSATDAEKEACRLVALAVRDHLVAIGWPVPVTVDSGNGWHLLCRIDLPNSDHSRTLIKAVVYKLAEKFDSATVEIDKKVHNANRVSKLPGCMARKGMATADRPHRPCRLVHVPDALEVVSAELLQALTQVAEVPQAVPSVFQMATGSTDQNKYVQAAIDQECGRIAMAGPGQRNEQLNKSAFALGQFSGAGLVARAKLEEILTVAAYRCGLNNDTGCGELGIASTIKSGLDAGEKDPRKVPERNGRPGPTGPGPKIEPGKQIIIRASSITPRKVEWLWPGRIPLGKLTTFAGVGGLGKTFVLCDITARVTRGADWPDSAGECCETGQVLFVSGEDEADDTIVPRLIEMGADLNKVIFLTTEVQDRFTLADLSTLETAIEQAGGNVRFIAIDPPTAYLGGVDDHKNAELRGLLSPMKSWAAKHRLALVFNTHVNKGGGQKFEAMMRVMGSVAWVNAVRAAHMFAKDADSPDRRLFVPMKMNVGKERKGLAYRLAEVGELARVEWLGEVDTTADEAVAPPKKMTRDVRAADWLIERFREKREWDSEDLFRVAKEQGVSRSAIFAAKAALELPKAKQVVYESGNRTWIWWVPENWAALGMRPGNNLQAEPEPAEAEF